MRQILPCAGPDCFFPPSASRRMNEYVTIDRLLRPLTGVDVIH